MFHVRNCFAYPRDTEVLNGKVDQVSDISGRSGMCLFIKMPEKIWGKFGNYCTTNELPFRNLLKAAIY